MQISGNSGNVPPTVVSGSPLPILDVDFFDPNDFSPLGQKVAETLVAREKEQRIAPVANTDEVRARFSQRGMHLVFHTDKDGNIPIAVQIALTSASVARLRDITSGQASENVEEADTAHMFSVIKDPKAEAGISAPFFRGVKPLITSAFPHITRAATFSPIPGYLNWIKDNLDHDFLNDSGAARVFRRDLGLFKDAVARAKTFEHFGSPEIAADMWRMAAFYLTAGEQTKRGFSALNTVAKTHFLLGGQLDRIILFADDSEEGLGRSGGVMTSWVHPLIEDEIDANILDYRGGNPPVSDFIGVLKQRPFEYPTAFPTPRGVS